MSKKNFWNDLINKLLLVRLGQELGANSQLAQYVASFIDNLIIHINKILLIGIFFHINGRLNCNLSFEILFGYVWRF